MELPTMRFVPLVIAAVVLNILFYFFCLNHIGPASVGIAYNALNGEVTSQKHAGWYITSPFVRVASIDTANTGLSECWNPHPELQAHRVCARGRGGIREASRFSLL
jgi:hypothetical protein